MHPSWNKMKTLLIFLLIVLLLASMYHPDKMHEITAAVTAAFGG